ncbi:MAG: tRNA uridine-5-carboxymethylaminomethyl(34) synthesis GTPase MnmE [Verrucomicrobia bacterium]|nr:tRNA uridine-5-carboxymethylaminomethyl(34) synthesis GTPase MnmE [Verrucomicrobiota bacterium]
MTDTIAAISTALGEAAISVLRLSGPDSEIIATKIFRSKQPVRQLSARSVTQGRIVDDADRTVDEVLLTIFRGPASYTGEDVIEISAHGGILVTRRIYELLLTNGARAAMPGEFTQRAFLNGKMDLTQAEAVMDLIHAQSELSLQAAAQQLEGRLGTEAGSIREDLLQLVAHVEAYIDFPDEDIDPDTGAALKLRMESIHARLCSLLDTAEHGRILRSGARTVICGAPNVGKSSLLNALSGQDRAIVSPQAGTTRDTIEEVLHIHGLPFVLVDTAGLRTHTSDFIESEGIQRTKRELERADVIIEVVDGSVPQDEAHRVPVTPGKRGHLLALNKADAGLHPSWGSTSGLSLSCQTGVGLDLLRSAMRDAVWSGNDSGASPLVAINARHQRCFQRAAEAMEDAEEAFEHDGTPELIAFELRDALQAVGEVTGRVDVEEVLGAIFSRFCIGK